jgi:protein ImuB
MLWLCLSLPHLAVELNATPQTHALAGVDRIASRRILIACNESARNAGLHAGMDAALALGHEPSLQLIERNKPSELHALKALAGWAEQFSSHVSFDAKRWLLWLEVGASRRYFGGLQPLRAQIGAGIASLGYTACVGIAPTSEAAAILASADNDTPLTSQGAIAAVLGTLPLQHLALDAKCKQALQSLGLQSIAQVLQLPAAALARRFGAELTGYLQRVLGIQADPKTPYRSPQVYRRRFEFVPGVETIEALLFPLRRLLIELQGYLRGRDTALQALVFSLCHRDAAETRLQLRTTIPQRDALPLFALVREKLERTGLPAAVIEIAIEVQAFVAFGHTQSDLFDDHTQRDLDWSELLDKLRARLGENSVRRLGLADDHRPEKAWCVPSSTEETVLPAGFPERPLWILEPRPIERLPQLLGTPERIESGWWSGEDSSRDYYLARTAAGERWWLYREAATQQWFLHGLWA